MRRNKAIFATPFLALFGCDNPKPTVVLDNWWTIDYARNACTQSKDCGYDKDNPAGVLDYIATLKTAFASSANCIGVDVLDFRNPENPIKEPDYHETLMIDYQSGNEPKIGASKVSRQPV